MIPNSFDNLVWNALHSVHSHFNVRNGPAARYPADVVPYAAMADANHSDLSSLAELLSPGERVYLIGAQPTATNILDVGPPLNCLQMLFPSNPGQDTTAASSDTPIASMKPEDAPDMVALTDLAPRQRPHPSLLMPVLDHTLRSIIVAAVTAGNHAFLNSFLEGQLPYFGYRIGLRASHRTTRWRLLPVMGSAR